MLRPSLLVIAALALAGCFQSDTVITVRADGSAEIVERTVFFGRLATQMLDAADMGGSGRELAQSRADALGARLVSDTSRVVPGALVRRAVFAVDDVEALRYTAGENLSDGSQVIQLDGTPEPGPPALRFALDRGSDNRPTQLRVTVPPDGFGGPSGAPDDLTPESLNEAYERAMLIVGQTRFRLSLVAEPGVDDATGGGADGDTLTLAALDAAAMLAHLREADRSGDTESFDAFKEALGAGLGSRAADLPGYRVVGPGEVSVALR